uniref:Uncharacterized protein n=1 Tax=Trichuris muris TaxID=70415 RepID=A0A5S6QL30_TRIMR
MDTPFASLATWTLFLLQTMSNGNLYEVQTNTRTEVSLPPTLQRPTPSKVHKLERNWTTVSPGYSPTPWNAPCMAKSCDSSIEKISEDEHNRRRSESTINRKRAMCCCAEHRYEVKDGYPLNPSGRTGLSGRGLCPRWGPNHYIKLLFVKKEKSKKDVMHFLLSLNGTDDLENAYFEGFVDDPEEEFFPADLHDTISYDLNLQFKDSKKAEKLMKKARKRSARVLGGSVPSHMNTDHAWVEGQVYLVLCEKNVELCEYGLRTLQTKQGYRWFLWNRESSIRETERLTKSMPNDDEETRTELAGYSIFCQGCHPDMKLALLGATAIGVFVATILTIRFSILAVWLASLTAGIVGVILLPLAVLITTIILYDFMERIKMK